jgi:ribonucleotide reductase alpha subunit
MIVSQIETGTPYVLNKDACNEKTNQKNIGTIKSSNLCVSGDTMILTDKGSFYIKELHNQKVNVWNGEEFSETTIHQTGINQKLLKLTFSNGSELKCTPYHKFYIKNNQKIEANLLKVGQELEPFFYPNNTNPQRITLLSTEILEEKEDTYCFTEPKLGKGMFNKILTGNCAEIVEYSDNNEYAVCVLSSVCLPKFVENGQFNHQKLFEIMQVVVDNLNNVIDKNFYPVPETKTSNMTHRPLGIGVQGLADVYAQLRLPYDSPEAKQLNKEIFETMYYGALYASYEQSKIHGPYSSYDHSPISDGKFQYNLWGLSENDLTNRWDWVDLRKKIKEYGIRNSLLIALMPTASTSQIMGNNESFECYTTNIYTRTTLAGDFIVVNKYLVQDLIDLGLWSPDMKDKIIYHQGSIQLIDEIPQNIKNLYKTVWEISQKHIIDQASDRAPFVCQSQSMNLYFQNPSYAKISSALLYAYSKGLKTLSYYTRSKTSVSAEQFSLDADKVKQITQHKNNECESCSG